MDDEAMRSRGGVGEGATKGFQFGAPAVKLFPNMIGADPKGQKERGISMRHKMHAPYTLSTYLSTFYKNYTLRHIQFRISLSHHLNREAA